jgi:hypothetical protein
MHLPFTSSGSRKSTRKVPRGSAMGLICLVSAFSLIGCEKSPTGPEPIKDPRAYTWTIDTLYISVPVPTQILLNSIWGTSNNLYAVGHSAGSEGTMWHFDGTRWTNVKLGSFEGGTIPAPFDLAAIHGLSADNIYAVGLREVFLPGRSFIIHYDGKQWTEQQAPSGSYFLQAVWANGPNDVWACGINGTLLHYDGIQWNKDSVTVATPPGSTFYLGSIARLPSGEMFMLGAAYEPGSQQMPERWTYYFFRHEGSVWKLLDTFVRSGGDRSGKWGGGGRLAVLPSGTMYSVDSYGVFQWNGTQWIRRYDNVSNTAGVFGTGDNNLFVTGAYGLLVHYNGVDWFQYTNLTQQNTHYAVGWADEKQAFVLGWVDGEKTVVLRGR